MSQLQRNRADDVVLQLKTPYHPSTGAGLTIDSNGLIPHRSPIPDPRSPIPDPIRFSP